METIETRERELLKAYVDARNKKDRLDSEASAAGKELDATKTTLVIFLEDMGKRSTGKYSELGSVLITEPIAAISVNEENRPSQFAFLKEIGAEAVIKQTVHHATFASIIRERLEKGEEVPGFVKIAYVPQVKYLKPTE